MTRKELKEAYKNRKPRMGVYQIRNKVNGKRFVEGSPTLDSIWNRHRVELNTGNHRNAELQREWTDLGEQSFVYEILDEIDPGERAEQELRKEIKTLEKMYLEELKPYAPDGYNTPPRN